MPASSAWGTVNTSVMFTSMPSSESALVAASPSTPDRNLDDHVIGECGKGTTLLDHAIAILGGDLSAHGTVNQLADLDKMPLEILELATRARVEARIGRDTGERAP